MAPVRTALVTGAARGIGRATAEEFARSGWRVVAGVRDPAALEPFDDRDVGIVRLDVTDPATVRAGVAEAEEMAGGALECVVNNAGWALFGAVEDVNLGLAREEFETNFFGAVAVIQAAVPAMRRAGRGTIVAVSTLAGRVPLPLFGMYSATKLSLAAVSEAAAMELGPTGIRVVVIEAGVVRTEMARSTRISGAAGEADSDHAVTRDRLLGGLRAVRQEAGLPASSVAQAIRRAAEDPDPPLRVVLPDERLAQLLDDDETPDETHARVMRFFGLPVPGEGPAP